MRAADLMTSFVVTVRPDATIEYAAQLMLQYRISGLPVTVVRQADAAIVEKAGEGRVALEHVIDCLGEIGVT